MQNSMAASNKGMRARLRELLREEFAYLVTDPSRIDSELATIQQASSRD